MPDPDNISKHQLDPNRWAQNHGDYLFSYAVSRVNGREMAEDLVQETMLSAFQAKDSFRGGSTERTWLMSILKRKVIDYYRKKARNPESTTDMFEMPFYNDGTKEGGWMEDRAPSEWDPEKLDEDDDDALMQVLKMCISQLNPRMASTFTLKTLEEIPTDEICKELGISESNLWVLLHRARLQLRECIDNKWFKD